MATAIREQVSSDGAPSANWFVSGPAIVAYLASLEFPIHLSNPGGYGFFIDELYFMACGQHLSWGYVDMPPLSAVQAWAARALFGDSLLAIRIFPTIAAAGLVILTGALYADSAADGSLRLSPRWPCCLLHSTSALAAICQ